MASALTSPPGAARGVTLVELLVVLAVVGVLLGLAVTSYARWMAGSAVRQGVQVFAAALGAARTTAKRTGTCQRVWLPVTAEADAVNVSRYAAGSCTGLPVDTASTALPDGVVVTLDSATNAVAFQPPHGTTDATDKTFSVSWRADPSIRAAVRVTGVFGRVIVR